MWRKIPESSFLSTRRTQDTLHWFDGIVGALLVLGAGVLLVTRRRARANEQ